MNVPAELHESPYASRHFREIVQHAQATNPFYARWIKESQHVAILDRQTLAKNNDEILNGHPVTARTSGSTGIPVRISQSHERSLICQKDVARFVAWLGGPLPCSRIIYPSSDEQPDWLLNIHASLDEQIAFIQRRYREVGAVAVTTYPTNAELLAREVLDRGIEMSFIRRFGVYAESFDAHQEELIRQAFPNAQIWTTYSSMEFGMIAARCPHEPNFHHLMAHKLGVELLGDDGQPTADDEIGRVVITDYFNRTAPLIRYEIGDLAMRGNCPCGRIRLPALRRILGKVRGALLHRDGRRVVFVDLSVALRDIPDMRQFQVVQENIERFTAKVVIDRPCDNEIRGAFEAHFGYLPSELQIQYVDEIPREANGKFFTSICNV